MALELGSAYVTLLPSAKGFGKKASKALTPGARSAGTSAGAAMSGAMGGTLSSKLGGQMKNLGSSMAGSLKQALIPGLGSVAAIGATAIAKGFSRLNAIDQAKAKLDGLGHSAQAVEQVMKDANAAVKGTAFGLDEAATTAAGAMAAGVKEGADLERYLKSVADAATIAGVDMSSMGSIFNKVGASNKVQGDVIAQLSDAGIPALQFLAKEMGVTAEEASKMASAGKVDFETFRAAMEGGLGGAAQASGKTMSGAFKNMIAALGRVGANLLSGVFPLFQQFFTGVTGALKPMEGLAKLVGEAIGAAFTGIGQWASTHVLPAFTAIKNAAVDTFGNLVSWAQQNEPLLKRLATIFGVLAAAVGTYRLAVVLSNAVQKASLGIYAAVAMWQMAMQVRMKGVTAATVAQAAAQRILNAVMRLNPIGLLITAIVGLVAAFAVLWNTNEGFRTSMTNAWNAVKNVIVGVWTSYIQPALTTFGNFFTQTLIPTVQRFWTGVVQPVFSAVGSFISAAWYNVIWPVLRALIIFYKGTLYPTVLRFWTNTVQPAFKAIGEFITNTWNNIIKPALSALWGFVTNTLAPAIMWLWNNIVKPYFNLVGSWIKFIWDAFIKPALTLIWEFISKVLAPIIMWLWNAIVAPAFKAIGAIIQLAWNYVIKPALNAIWTFISKVLAPIVMWLWKTIIAPAFSAIGSLIKAAWDVVIKPTLDALSNAMKAMPGVFDKAASGIGKAWDWIRKLALTPVEFVVQTVFNQGLIAGMNKILKGLNLDDKFQIPSIPWSVKLATGGPVPGWSPNDSADNIPAWLTAGEFVTRRASVRKMNKRHPGVLEHINTHGDLPAYKSGGQVYDSERPGPGMGGRTQPLRAGDRVSDSGVWRKLKAWVLSNIPGSRITSAYRPTRTATGKISQHARGNAVDIVGPNMGAIFNKIASAYPNSYELIYSPAGGRQIWHGKNHMYTGVTRANHFDHVHWSMNGFNGPSAEGEDGGGWFDPFGAVWGLVTDQLKKLPYADSLPAQMGVGVLNKGIDGIKQWVTDKIMTLPELFGSDSSMGTPASVESWRGTVEQALGIAGLPTSEPFVSAWLRQIKSESGGNPNIAQQIRDVNGTGERAGVGLVQVIPSTFAAYRDKSLPNDRRNPLANLVAGMRYAKSRYGSRMLSVIGKGHGYAQGGMVSPTLYDTGGILQPGLTLVSNQTRKPETVRTAEQEKALQVALQGGTGDTININGIKYDSVTEFSEELNFALARRASSRRYASRS